MNVSIDLKDITIIDINGVFKYCTFVDKNEIIKRELAYTSGQSSHHYNFSYKGEKYHLSAKYNYLIDDKYEEWYKQRHDIMINQMHIIEELGEKYDKTRKSN